MEINTNRFSNLGKLQNLETSTPTTSEHSSIWSILLNYLHNEQRAYSLGHYGLRQNDMASDLWKKIDENADLDHKGIYSFDSVYADIAAASVRAWNESAKQLAPTDWQRENSLWNDSVEWLLRYIYQHIDPVGMVAYEESGHLIENEDGTINTKYLRGSIPVSYIKEKRYLYPDFTGDNAIRILYNEEEEQEYDPYTLDDRMGAIYYTLYNLYSSEFKTIMCGSSTLEEAYEQLIPLLGESEDGYSYNYFYDAVIGINEHIVFDDTDDEPQMLKNFYNYVVAFIKTDFDLEAVYRKVEEFVVWCDDNKTRLQDNYGVKISIDKQPRIWTLTIAPYDGETFGLMYKEFCEENGYVAPYVEIGDDFAFRVIDVKKADAGNAFVPESEMYRTITLEGKILKEVINAWVVPWYNINAHTYKYVRGTDRINSVLADDSHLQFTVTQDKKIYKYIRLIMPEYKRRVEVEDLNRNFWVIAQVISAISSYLFDDNSPIATTLKGLLNEIMQMWENVMYLWAAQSTLSEPSSYNDTHVEFVYVPNHTEQPYLKYDGFDSVSSSSTLQARLQYLIQTYTESNLCIIPIVRRDNYAKKYYSCELYTGAMLYDRNTDTSEWWSFGSETEDEWRDSSGIKIDVKNNSEIYNAIWAAMEKGRYYYYCAPLTHITLAQGSSSDFFYGGVRVIPEASYSSDVRHLSVTLNLEDAALTLWEGSQSLGKLTIVLDDGQVTSFTNSYSGKEITNPTYNDGDAISDTNRTEIERGWDLGEFPSYRILCEETPFDIVAGTIYGKPISLDFTESSLSSADKRGDYNGATFQNGRGGTQTFGTMDQVINFTQINDQIMLEYILQEKPPVSQGSSQVYLYTAEHPTSLWDNGLSNPLAANNAYSIMPHTDYLIGNGSDPSIYTYYKAAASSTDQTVTNYERNVADHCSQYSDFAAVLYGPDAFVSGGVQSYSSYFYTSKIPSTAYYNGSLLLYQGMKSGQSAFLIIGASDHHFFTYVKKGEGVSTDNWIIMYVQADGGQPILNSAVSAGYGFELSTPFDFTGYIDRDTTPRSNYNANYGIISHVRTTLFLPNQISYYQDASRICWGQSSYNWTYAYDNSSGFNNTISLINSEYELYSGSGDDVKNFFLYPENGVNK